MTHDSHTRANILSLPPRPPHLTLPLQIWDLCDKAREASEKELCVQRACVLV